MTELTEPQHQEQTELWFKKVSTIEYHALEVCEQVVKSYQHRLNQWEKNISGESNELSILCDADVKGLKEATFTLQYLLGRGGYRKYSQPRTLETALRNAGIEDETIILAEVGRAEEYLQTADDLKQKARALHERCIQSTYYELSAKTVRGEKLNLREWSTYVQVCEILSENH